MRKITMTIAAVLFFGWPLTALAAPPGIVTGVTATLQNGIVLVSWNVPQNNNGIAKYRIYYSHQSILGNGGAYDDFVTTNSTAPSFNLRYGGSASRLFVTVVAVTDTGEESAAFGSEASVTLPAGSLTSSSSSALSAPAPSTSAHAALRLLSATALSSSSLELTFSQPVTLLQADPFSCVTITDAQGHALDLLGIRANAAIVTLTTATQKPGVQYTVRVSNVWSVSSDEAITPDNGVAMVTAAGSMSSSPIVVSPPAPPSPPAPSTPPSSGIADVTNITLQRTQESFGLYTIVVSFRVPPSVSPVSFDVSQTVDGGITYSAPQNIAGDIRQLRIQNVPPGTFGILIRSRFASGEETEGAVGTISLPVAANQKLLPTQHDHVGLVQSGTGFTMILILSGAYMGWRRMKKLRLAQA